MLFSVILLKSTSAVSVFSPICQTVKHDVSEETIKEVKYKRGILTARPLAEEIERARGFPGRFCLRVWIHDFRENGQPP
jgi:hypothetical protein